MKCVKLVDATSSNGGKAIGLRELIKAGLRVPKGVAINPENLLELLSSKSVTDLKNISKIFNIDDLLAIRSSALCEDGAQQSFAGLYSSELNVENNPQSLYVSLKKVYESSLSPEIQKYSGNSQDQMGVVVQRMINPKYAGVMFTESTDLNGQNCCLIELVKGLGEQLVSGHVNTTRIIAPYDINGGININEVRVEGNINDKTIFSTLQDSIIKINQYFNKGMDIEWCIDSSDLAYIVQARPITKHILIPEIDQKNGTVASIGKCIGETYVINSDLDDKELLKEIANFKKGSILVAPFTDTQYMPAINKAIGIITQEGSILSHAAIISREKGIPCIVGMSNASEFFPTGTQLLMDTGNGIVKSKNYNSQCDNRDIDWESLYIFDNLLERKKIGNSFVIIESSPFNDGKVVAHIPEDLSSRDYNAVEYYVRKKYKQPAKFVSSEKYTWFDEFERFKNYDEFNSLLSLGKQICKTPDSKELTQYYKLILDTTRKLLIDKKNSTNNYDKFLCEEKMASLHLIADSIIPAGYGLLYVYKYIKSFNCNNFNDFLRGEFDQTNLKLANSFQFMDTLSNYRNSICQKFVDMGAYSFSYFDNREDRAAAANGNINSEDPVTDFYSIIKKNNNSITSVKTKNFEM